MSTIQVRINFVPPPPAEGEDEKPSLQVDYNGDKDWVLAACEREIGAQQATGSTPQTSCFCNTRAEQAEVQTALAGYISKPIPPPGG